MTTKTFEFTTWPCSDKYADDPKILQSAFKGLLGPERVKGLNTIFNGVDKEKSIGHGCLCWDSLQDHLNYIADKERQASVAEDFGSAMRLDVGGPIMEHVVLSVETTLRVLEAPLTEVARITFSDRASLEKAKPVVERYVAYASREETLPIAAAFGQTVDLENVEEMKIVFIVGWKSAEDQETFRNSDDVKAIIKEMDKVGEINSESRTISFNVILEEETT